MIYRLIALNGPLKGQRMTVDPEPMTIGRDPGCAIVLPDNEAALRHARIEQRGAELFIHDLGAINKVIVNKRAETDVRLKHGDIIELGRTRLLVEANVLAEIQEPASGHRPCTQRRGRKRKIAIGIAALLVAGVAAALIRSGHGSDEIERSLVDHASETSTDVMLPDIEARIEPLMPTGETVAANAPIDTELRQIREDLLFIQQHIEQLNRSPAALAESAGGEVTERPIPVDEIESVMTAARAAMEAGDFAEADLLLEHLQIEHPDYLPAYEARAELFESWGMPAKARDQWSAILQRTTETELYRRAVVERVRLGRADSQRQISAHDAVRIRSIEQVRFRETADYDEMRLVKVHLSYNRELGPIDPEGIRLIVYFFERDLDTERIELSKVQPYIERRLSEMENPTMDTFTQAVSYTVPKGYYQRDHHTSRQRYYGFIARLHYFDRLVDEQARPPKLLEPAVLEAAGLTLHTADVTSPSAIQTPASN